MQIIQLFIASSAQLAAERRELTELCLLLNPYLRAHLCQIKLILWEHLDSSMGERHKQEEYNDKLRACDLCLVLFATRLGRYTKIELDLAYERMCAGACPQQVHLWFREEAGLSPELQIFKEEAASRYPRCAHAAFRDALGCRLAFLQLLVVELSLRGIVQLRLAEEMLLHDGKPFVSLRDLGF